MITGLTRVLKTTEFVQLKPLVRGREVALCFGRKETALHSKVRIDLIPHKNIVILISSLFPTCREPRVVRDAHLQHLGVPCTHLYTHAVCSSALHTDTGTGTDKQTHTYIQHTTPCSLQQSSGCPFALCSNVFHFGVRKHAHTVSTDSLALWFTPKVIGMPISSVCVVVPETDTRCTHINPTNHLAHTQCRRNNLIPCKLVP